MKTLKVDTTCEKSSENPKGIITIHNPATTPLLVMFSVLNEGDCKIIIEAAKLDRPMGEDWDDVFSTKEREEKLDGKELAPGEAAQFRYRCFGQATEPCKGDIEVYLMR